MVTAKSLSYSEPGRFPPLARLLHLGLVLAFSFELLNSVLALWFQSFTLFAWHTLVGIFLTVWLALSWLVYLFTPWGRQLLWNWYWPLHWRETFQDLGRLFRGGLPQHGPRPGLSSYWQGAFFLLASWVTFSGFGAWLVMEGYLTAPGLTHLGLSSMRLGTPLLLYFWLGHVSMAIYHAARRQPLWNIFSWR
ncbi:MAG: cytochrome b/b6 domain-containing protein [Acidithiobacillus sp.]|nr:cytochrome b/b6 domain-containing protein [Acidithiobacillus sp.]